MIGDERMLASQKVGTIIPAADEETRIPERGQRM